MNTSYTIITALSKGVESITRHHSPLTTEYISFQHIYKSYDERGGGARRGLRHSKKDFWKTEWVNHGGATDQWTGGGRQIILTRIQTTNRHTSHCLANTTLYMSKQRSGISIWGDSLLQHSLCALSQMCVCCTVTVMIRSTVQQYQHVPAARNDIMCKIHAITSEGQSIQKCMWRPPHDNNNNICLPRA